MELDLDESMRIDMENKRIMDRIVDIGLRKSVQREVNVGSHASGQKSRQNEITRSVGDSRKHGCVP